MTSEACLIRHNIAEIRKSLEKRCAHPRQKSEITGRLDAVCDYLDRLDAQAESAESQAMRYGSGCEYEKRDGGCRKPSRVPCPENDEAVKAYEEHEALLLDLAEEKNLFANSED